MAACLRAWPIRTWRSSRRLYCRNCTAGNEDASVAGLPSSATELLEIGEFQGDLIHLGCKESLTASTYRRQGLTNRNRPAMSVVCRRTIGISTSTSINDL